MVAAIVVIMVSCYALLGVAMFSIYVYIFFRLRLLKREKMIEKIKEDAYINLEILFGQDPEKKIKALDNILRRRIPL